MKIKELPIFIDLFKLPPSVLLRRLLTRGRKPAELPEPTSEKWQNLEVIPQELPEPEGIAEEPLIQLFEQLKEDRYDFLGGEWLSLRGNATAPGFNGQRYRAKQTTAAIHWRRDHRSGYDFAADLSPAEALGMAFRQKGVDVKFCWEPARFAYLLPLRILALKRPDLAEEIQSLASRQLGSWQEQNPFNHSIHWASPMETGLRLMNFLYAAPVLEDFFNKEAGRRLIYEHWYFLQSRLEHKQGLGNNHYLANLCALIATAALVKLPEIEMKGEWAWREFQREFMRQFHGDGFNFEYSTYYHRLSTELGLVAFHFALKKSRPSERAFRKRLAEALQTNVLMLKPDGHLPQFGDNDSGRILDWLPVWRKGDRLDPAHSGFMKEIAERRGFYGAFYHQVLSRLDLPSFEHWRIEDSSQAPPARPKLTHQKTWQINHPAADLSALRWYHWPEAGLLIAKAPDYFFAVSLLANPRGARYRGHCHNDKGGFELQVHGRDLHTDPGVLSYTAEPELRNLYRGTAAHYLPITGKEQNPFLEGELGLFHLQLRVHCRLLKLRKHLLRIENRYGGVIHRREWHLHKDQLVIEDRCNRPFELERPAGLIPCRAYGELQMD